MAEKSQRSAEASDSFEALLRAAAQPSHASHRATLPSGAKLASGRFEITRHIGEGGMGVVYEALDAERRSKVALKTLSRLEAAGIYRLKNEFRALADVSHPNLVRLHELFADEALWFFTMDLVDGERFDAWVRQDGALHEARLRCALPELLRAVLAIHDAGKLHRDLKPSNVLVTRDGHVIVLDFGLAVDPELGGIGQTIADDSVSGTPAYMAPEQAAGSAATRASDFYALGVMLFEALTGRLPFEGRIGEMLAAKQTRAAPPVSHSNPDAPRDLATISAALLELAPQARLDGASLLEQLDDRPSSAPARASQVPHAAVELVGRDDEIGALHAAYGASCTGEKPVIVLLSGESGIGKSALLERFRSDLHAQGRAVLLSGRCYERESVPFKGFDVLIDELSRYLRKLGQPARDLLPREAYALRRLFPVLGRIEAIAQAPERAISDPIEVQRRGFLALGEMLGRIRDRQPLVIAIDDLQWSDLDSTRLLLHLVRETDAPRMLLVASHRSEGMQHNPVLTPLYEMLEIETRIDVRRLDLGPLSLNASASLVRNHGDAVQALVREAGGNPFLLGELARAGGVTRGHSLAQILSARVAELPPEQRALLEVLAVAARPLPLDLAASAGDIPELGRAAFDALRSAQLARSGVQRGSVECYHDRVREAVAAGLGAERTRAHHAALAQALVRTNDPDPEHLAEHFEHAGEAQLAAEHAIAAAERAKRAFAFDQAARLYRTALRLGAFERARARRLRVTLGNALARAGSSPEAAECYLRACEGADETEVKRLKLKAAQEYMNSGRITRGRELRAEALQAFGLRFPESPAHAAATLALERKRLRLRGLELASYEPDPAREAELAALFRSSGLGWDVVSAGALNLQLLRRALDAGLAVLSVVGLHNEIYARTFGVGDAAKVPQLVRRTQLLGATLSNPLFRAYRHFQLAQYEISGHADGNLEVALEHSEQSWALTHADLRGFTFNDRVNAQLLRSMVLRELGRFTDQTRELSAPSEDWQQRKLIFTVYAGGLDLAWLALGARAKAERELGRAVQAWSRLENPYTTYDSSLHRAQLLLCHDRGDARAAWAQCVAHDERFAASFLSRSSHYAAAMRVGRGLAAATLAAETTDQAERRSLLREADRASSNTRGIRSRQRWLLLVRAAAACARRDREHAVHLLRELDAGPRPPAFGPVYTYATRRRLGVLLGGDEGKALVSAADAFFRAGGAIDPERLVATLLPGCEIR